MNQTDRVLRHLKRYRRRGITPLEAMENYGIMRLADVVFKLKKKGHVIDSQSVEGENRFGEKVRYAKYTLVKEADK